MAELMQKSQLALNSMLLFSRSVMPNSFETLWTVAHQAPLSMGFLRQKYWGGLPFPSPGDLPDPGLEPMSPALQVDSLPAEPQEKPMDRGAWWDIVPGVARVRHDLATRSPELLSKLELVFSNPAAALLTKFRLRFCSIVAVV